MDLLDYRLIGKYEVSRMCLTTYPCKHYVRYPETGEEKLLTATKIYTMLQNDGITDLHFNYCKEIIRKKDNPTPEEISQKEEERRKMDEQREKRNKEQEELTKLTNTYKASSRLDRLKEKHCIS